MNKKTYKYIITIFYMISFFIFLYCIKIRFTKNTYIETNIRILILLLACLLIYINGILLIKQFNFSKKILKVNLIIYFLVYTFTICTLTLFDEIFGRQGFVVIKWNRDLLKLYMKYSFNIIPFKTIKLFTNGYINGIVSAKNFYVNIFGNLCAFMPYGMFLPMIFKKINKYYKFLITMILIVVVIEVLQFITMSGSCDIDDLILNVVGATIIYLIYKIKPVNKIIYRLFLLG